MHVWVEFKYTHLKITQVLKKDLDFAYKCLKGEKEAKIF